MRPKFRMYLLGESDAHDDGAGREDDGGEEDRGLAPEALAERPGHQREQPCRAHLEKRARGNRNPILDVFVTIVTKVKSAYDKCFRTTLLFITCFHIKIFA